MRRAALLWVFLLAAPGVRAEAEGQERASVVLTAQENRTVPQTEFSCYGKIHGYLRLPVTAVGKHLLEALWTLPNKTTAADSRNEVDFPSPGRSTAYVWFDFPEAPSIGTLDSNADGERLTYPGTWNLIVRWDDTPIIQSAFTVHCP